MKKSLALMFFAALLFCGCNAQKDQPKPGASYYRDYRVTYNKTKDSTTVFAIIYDMRTADTAKLPVTALQVNGVAGTLNPDNTFAWHIQGLPDIHFTYNTTSGMLRDTVLLSELGHTDFNASTPDTVSLTDTTRFTVDCVPAILAPPLVNEEIFIGFEIPDSSTLLHGIKPGYKKLSDNNVIIDPQVVKLLSPGMYRFILFRNHYIKLKTDQYSRDEVWSRLEIERKVILK